MMALLDSISANSEIAKLTTIGLNDEQQHQKLLLIDTKRLFSQDPMLPALRRRSK